METEKTLAETVRVKRAQEAARLKREGEPTQIGTTISPSILSRFSTPTAEDEARWKKNEEERAAIKASQERYAFEERVRKGNLPARHKEMRLADGSGVQATTVARIVGAMGSGAIFALVGERSTGKTQVAIWAAGKFALAGKYILYTKAMLIFLAIRAAYRKDGPSEEEAMMKFVNPGLLIIDEAHVRGDTPFEDRILTTIIDLRYDAMRETILIANRKAGELADALGTSVTERIQENGGWIECTSARGWKNWRSEK